MLRLHLPTETAIVEIDSIELLQADNKRVFDF